MTEKLLIVDDEPLILNSLSDLFEDHYEVFTTNDAEAALRLARDHDFATILSDERMPGMSGHELLRRVRETSRATRLLMSGYTDMSALTEAVNSGQIFAYIVKPWEPLQLRSQVRAAVVHFKLAQEMEQERELLRALMENIPDLIYFKDCQSRFTRVNQAQARNLGASDSAECIGKSNADYFEPEDAIRWRLLEEEIVKSGRADADRIEQLQNPRGGLDWWSTTKVPMFDRGGQVSGIAGISRNITALKAGEEMLKREATLVRLLQSVTVAANRSSSIEDIAQTCLDLICAYLGWPVGHVYLWANNSPEELNSAEFWHVEEPRRFADFIEAGNHCRFVAGAGLPGCVVASGKPQWIVSIASEEPLSERSRAAAQAGLQSGFGLPILVEERVAGVLEFFSAETAQADEEFLTITEHIGSQLGQVIIRQRAEEELRRAKASAEASNRAKSEFLSTMSHEMRTPMNAIIGTAELLSGSALDEEQMSHVRMCQRASLNLLGLINDILDLSKVESGHVELESIGFDLTGLLKKTIEMLVPRARERDLDLTLEILLEVPLVLVGDPYRLQQILVNLLGNALKFTERGSVTLRVQPDPASTGGKEGPVWIRFNVVDTGIGIAADKAEMIFERFTQADSSTTRKYGGTGLGLAISKGLAELMGARIGCISELGKGSTFYLVGPFEIGNKIETSEPAEPVAIAIPPMRPAGQGPVSRILVVDDCEDNVALVRAYLKGCGFELDFAVNGEQAVEKVISGNLNLVLMDLQMPVMGGLEATRAIRQWEAETQTQPIPILAVTAQAEQEGGDKSRAAGCNAHITKPVSRTILLEHIFRHLARIQIKLPEGIEGLVPSYLAHVRRDMAEILAGSDSKDWETARRLGHQFKGSGESYGFLEITRTGAAVELASKAGDADEIRGQIMALSNYLERVEFVV